MSEENFPPHPNQFLYIMLTLLILLTFSEAGYLIGMDYRLSDVPEVSVVLTMSKLVIVSTPLLILFLLLSSPRIKLSRLNAERLNDPEIKEFVNSMKREMGISKSLEIYLAQNVRGQAVVFGFRKHFIVISKELYKSFNTLPHLVRPIIIHELSHIKNADVFANELSEAAWKAYTLIALLSGVYVIFHAEKIVRPLHSSSGFPMPFYDITTFWIWNLFIPSFLLFLLNRQASKYREFYADYVTNRIDKNLITSLRMLCFPKKGRFFQKQMVLQRIEALEEPFKIFIPGFWHGFIVESILMYGYNFGSGPLPILFFFANETFILMAGYIGILIVLPPVVYFLKNHLMWFAKEYSRKIGKDRVPLNEAVRLILRIAATTGSGMFAATIFTSDLANLFVHTMRVLAEG